MSHYDSDIYQYYVDITFAAASPRSYVEQDVIVGTSLRPRQKCVSSNSPEERAAGGAGGG